MRTYGLGFLAAIVTFLTNAATVSFTPQSGSTFNTSLDVSLRASDVSATIYYTVNGGTPTLTSLRYVGPFQVTKKTTVKAIAVVGGVAGAVASATYAPGVSAIPVVSPSSGESFWRDGQLVTITCATSDSVLRYTLDGSEPTETSSVYSSPIAISATTTIKAKAFSSRLFDSAVVTATIYKRVATPIITATEGEFGSYQTITIASEVPGATVYYTTDGSIPSALNGNVYSAPFLIEDRKVVRAVAVKSGEMNSEVAELTVGVAAPPSGIGNKITSVTAHPRYPWNGLVDIDYSVIGNRLATNVHLEVSCSVGQEKLSTYYLYCDSTNNPVGAGKHRLSWNALLDGCPAQTDGLVISLSIVEGYRQDPFGLYAVVDVSGGTGAKNFPVSYRRGCPIGGWDGTCKESKIVLRCVPAGTFKMTNVGNVTLTHAFFTGIYEITQRQWELITGMRPSYFNNNANYASRPVEQVTYGMVRGDNLGYGFPMSSSVDDDSFLGVLRMKTGLVGFDLPTDAEWEYSCRAGTTTDLNTGKSWTDENRYEVGRFPDNGGEVSRNGFTIPQDSDITRGTAKVGSYVPNTWGLYDMHGNVWELTRDWCADYVYHPEGVVDPLGVERAASSYGAPAVRGGGWWQSGYYGSIQGDSSARKSYELDYAPPFIGCRIVLEAANGISKLMGTNPKTYSDPADGKGNVYFTQSSEAVTIDTVPAGSIRTISSVTQIRPISFGSAWNGDLYEMAGVHEKVAVSVNGARVVQSSLERSSLDWIPTIAGSYVLTHQGCKGGAPEGEMLTAKFNVLPTTTSISPASGTVIKNGDKVVMSCSDPNAVIYYTVDGTEPTVKSRVYTEPIECEEKTLFKAVGITRGVFKSNVVAAEYAFGFAQQPVFGQVSGTVFSGDGFTVSLTCQTAGVEIHYTVDGSAPTRESPLYTSPIALHGTTTVKAKAFSDKYFDSEISSAKYIRKAVVPVVSSAATFSGDYQSVTITSADGGAVIYYTLDGSAPSSTHGFVYNGPFKVDDSCMIRAVAAVGGYEMSDVVERKTTSLTPPSGVGNKVVSVTAAPRLPWNGKVDIGYRVEGNTRATNTVATITVSADDVGEVYIYAYEGVVGAGAGNYQIVWDAVQDGWKDVVSNVVVKVTLGSARADANEEIDVEFADQEWILDESETVDGVIPFKSPKVDDFGATSIIAHTPGPGYFSFKWKVASEANYDFLRCLIDETEMRHISGVTEWEDAKVWVEDTVPVVFRWEYVKDQSGSVAPDCGWVGGIKWTTSYGAIIYSEKSAAPVALGKVYSPITYANLYGSTHSNPDSYQEGAGLGFTPPSGRTGYTFTGWSPAAITADMTGAQTVTAGWRANTYQIAYYANGGSGTMTATACEYDKEGEIAANGFTRSGYVFKGWAMEENGVVVYQPGAKVTNLTSNDSGVVKLYAVWELEAVETPVIVPDDGAVFRTTSCKVSISCATEGARIYYTTNGRTPREDERCLYTGEFEIEDTTTVIAFAVLDGKSSEFSEALITKGSSESLTLENVLDAGNLTTVSTGGDADWCPIEDVASKVGGACAVSGVLDESDGEVRESWLEVKVSGKGTLTFWWRISCDPDPRGKYTYDYASCEVEGELVARTDGEKDWVQISKTFDVGGDHVVRWTYLTDGWESEGYDGCVWVDGVEWSPLTVAEPIPELPPSASVDEVRAALEGSADAKLQANITDATVYGRYREWAMKIGAEDVKGAANSWISFAVDSAALLEKVPVDSDLKIEEFKPASAEGAFDFTVSVKDVTVGSGATDANLKKVFGLGGTTQLGTEEFDPDKVALKFGTPVNGKLKFTASPKDKTAKSFFMKMKVK